MKLLMYTACVSSNSAPHPYQCFTMSQSYFVMFSVICHIEALAKSDSNFYVYQ